MHEQQRRQLQQSRVWGKVSALFFFLAALAVVDSLQGHILSGKNSIRIVGGHTTQIAGMVPEGIEQVKDIRTTWVGPHAVTFTPTERFSGFWMGGGMWRATLTAPVVNATATGTLVVQDVRPVPDGATGTDIPVQNPDLIFTVAIFPTAQAMQAAAPAWLERLTGTPAWQVAVMAAFLAVACAFLQWWGMHKAVGVLAAQHIFLVHGVRTQGTTEVDVEFSLPKGVQIDAGTPATLLTRGLEAAATGHITQCVQGKAAARFPATTPLPCYAYFVATK